MRGFLHNGYVYGDATLFKGVDCLPGGATIACHKEFWKVQSYDHILPKLEREHYKDAPYDVLLKEGTRVFLESVERCYIPGRTIVVPISGGMDSRALLAALLEMVPKAKDIHTYTFGQPGSLDYDLGNRIAKEAGTTHRTWNMSDVTYTEDRLIQTARQTDANTDLMQPYVLTYVHQAYPDDAHFWSGFPGDFWGGSFFRAQPSRRWLEAVDWFTHREHYAYYDHVRWESDWKIPIGRHGIYEDAVDHDARIFLNNHVERYTAHHLFMTHYDFACPFVDDALIVFYLSIDQRWRAQKKLFNDIFYARFPRLFALPTKAYGYGSTQGTSIQQHLWHAKIGAKKALWRATSGGVPHPDMSYMDFAKALRTRTDVRHVAKTFLTRLKQHDAIDTRAIDTIWREHNARTTNHAATLTLLISLGAILEAFDVRM